MNKNYKRVLMKLLHSLPFFFTSFILIVIGLSDEGSILFLNIGIAVNIISLNALLKEKRGILPSLIKDISTELLAEVLLIFSITTVLKLFTSQSIVYIISTIITIIATLLYLYFHNRPQNLKADIDIEQLALDVQRVVDTKLEFLPHKIDDKYHYDKEITKGKDVVLKHVNKGNYSHAMNHIKHMIEATKITLSEEIEEEYQYLLKKHL